MVQFNQPFQTASAPAQTALDPVPTGEYAMVALSSEMKPTKNGQGSYLEFTFEILDGMHKARKLWLRLNLVNSNATAVEIAQRQLADLCRACGREVVSDSSELHGTPVIGVVRLKPASGTYRAGNEIDTFKACANGGVVPPVAPAQTTETAAPVQSVAAVQQQQLAAGQPVTTPAPAAPAAPVWAATPPAAPAAPVDPNAPVPF